MSSLTFVFEDETKTAGCTDGSFGLKIGVGCTEIVSVKRAHSDTRIYCRSLFGSEVRPTSPVIRRVPLNANSIEAKDEAAAAVASRPTSARKKQRRPSTPHPHVPGAISTSGDEETKKRRNTIDLGDRSFSSLFLPSRRVSTPIPLPFVLNLGVTAAESQPVLFSPSKPKWSSKKGQTRGRSVGESAMDSRRLYIKPSSVAASGFLGAPNADTVKAVIYET